MACQGDLGALPQPFSANGATQGVGRGDFPPHSLTLWVLLLSWGSGGARGAKPGAPGARVPPHTDGCFDSVERLT